MARRGVLRVAGVVNDAEFAPVVDHRERVDDAESEVVSAKQKLERVAVVGLAQVCDALVRQLLLDARRDGGRGAREARRGVVVVPRCFAWCVIRGQSAEAEAVREEAQHGLVVITREFRGDGVEPHGAAAPFARVRERGGARAAKGALRGVAGGDR